MTDMTSSNQSVLRRVLPPILIMVSAMALLYFWSVSTRTGTQLHARMHALAPGLFPNDATGSINSIGYPGNWTMHIDMCRTGAPHGMRGVLLYDTTQPDHSAVLSYPIEGDASISVEMPNTGKNFRMMQSECSTWDVDLQGTGRIQAQLDNYMQGHARFQCTMPDGATKIDGNLQLTDCIP